MMTIKSGIFKRGHEHESDVISDEPQGEKGSFYYDKELKRMMPGRPPNRNNRFGVAPVVIFDSMNPTYHEAACRVVESRKEWEELDKAHGCITFGNVEASKPRVDEANEKKKKKAELRKASREAIRAWRENPQEAEQKMTRQAEEQRESLEKSGLQETLNQAIKEHV